LLRLEALRASATADTVPPPAPPPALASPAPPDAATPTLSLEPPRA
jgi:hypothetical protein